MTTARGIVVRILSFSLAWVAYALVADAVTAREGGANIGVGLVAFAAVVVAAGVWGLVDGIRRDPRALATVWLPVAVVLGLLGPLWIASRESGFTWDVLASDLAGLSPFMAALVAVPAMLGGLVAQAFWSPASSGHSPA